MGPPIVYFLVKAEYLPSLALRSERIIKSELLPDEKPWSDEVCDTTLCPQNLTLIISEGNSEVA